MSRIRRINVPDYDEAKVIDVKSNLDSENKWTAPANGYFIPHPLRGYDNSSEIYINDISITYVRSSNQYSDSNNSGPIPVAKGDVIKIESPNELADAVFYPCK